MWIVPSPSKIEIAGGSSYLFSFYFFTYWAEWKAGSLVVWVEDTKEKVVSNQISISVAFQKGSIPLLLDLVAKEPAPLPSLGRITPEMRRAILRRKQAAEWLSKLDPTFQIDEVREQDDAATKARKIAANEKAVRTFREFWEAKKDSDEVKAVFAKLNEDTARKPVK